MRLMYFLVGIVFIIIGFYASNFAIPWIEWTPLPTPTLFHPFLTIGAIFYVIGGILTVAGLTANWVMRLLLSFLIIVFVWLWLNPSIPLYVGVSK